jgi:hypothetical protein
VSSITTTNFILPVNLKLIKIWIDVFEDDDGEKNRNVTRNFFLNNKLSDKAIMKIFIVEYEDSF